MAESTWKKDSNREVPNDVLTTRNFEGAVAVHQCAGTQNIYMDGSTKSSIKEPLEFGFPMWVSDNMKMKDNEKERRIIGRDKEVQDLLTIYRNTSKRIVISGFSGKGKTSLALLCAETWMSPDRPKPRIITNAVFINSETETSLRESFETLAIKLDIQKIKTKKLLELIKEIYDCLTGDTLMIFDNVVSYSSIKQYLSNKNHILILITSQMNEFDTSFYIFPLTVLSEENSILLVQNLLGLDLWLQMKTQINELKTLLKILQYLPLAILQATTYIKHKNSVVGIQYSFENYKTEYNNILMNSKTKRPYPDYIEDTYEKTVYRGLALNIEFLKNDDDYTDNVLIILHIISYLRPDTIRKERLLEYPDMNDNSLCEILRLLRKFSLCEYSSSSNAISIHRLVQDICRTICCDLDVELKRMVAIYLQTLFIKKPSELININLLLPITTVEWFYESCLRAFQSGIQRNKLKYSGIGTNTTIDNLDNWTVYHYAAYLGIWQIFVNLKIDSTAKTNKFTTLEKVYEKQKLLLITDNELKKTEPCFISSNDGIALVRLADAAGRYECVRVLLSIGACATPVVNMLYWATEAGDVNCIRDLIQHGANLNIDTNRGITPLVRVVQCGRIEYIGELIKLGANVNAATSGGMTILHAAVEWGRADCVRELVRMGADIKLHNHDGESPLFRAIKLGRTDCVREIVAAGADVNEINSTGGRPLYKAVQFGYADCVKELICAGVELNTITTALPVAAGLGYVDCLKELVNGGADANAATSTGEISLHRAAENGNIDCIKELIKAGTDLNAATTTGKTSLHRAVEERKVDCVEELVNAGANINAATTAGETPLHIAVMHKYEDCFKKLINLGSNINAATFAGETPLYKAVQCRQMKFVKELINVGVDMNIATTEGRTPLHCAVDVLHERIDFVKELVNAGTNVNAVTTTGETPLHLACGHHSLDSVKELVNAGANVNAATITGKTPLHITCGQWAVDCLKELVNAGANVDAATTTGETPLHTACCGYWFNDCVKELINAGANVNAATTTGKTPLHMASGHLIVDCLKELLNAGANVNTATNAGETPLHVASRTVGYSVRELVNAGADVNAATISGITSLHEAARKGYIDCVGELVNAGANVNATTTAGETPIYVAVTEMQKKWNYKFYEKCVCGLLKAGADINARKPLPREAASMLKKLVKEKQLHIKLSSSWYSSYL